MSASQRLRILAATLSENRLDLWAREASAIAVLVARMEVTLEEIVSDAAEAADNAERAARMNVVPLRPRLRLVGSPAWHGPSDGVG